MAECFYLCKHARYIIQERKHIGDYNIIEFLVLRIIFFNRNMLKVYFILRVKASGLFYHALTDVNSHSMRRRQRGYKPTSWSSYFKNRAVRLNYKFIFFFQGLVIAGIFCSPFFPAFRKKVIKSGYPEKAFILVRRMETARIVFCLCFFHIILNTVFQLLSGENRRIPGQEAWIQECR